MGSNKDYWVLLFLLAVSGGLLGMSWEVGRNVKSEKILSLLLIAILFYIIQNISVEDLNVLSDLMDNAKNKQEKLRIGNLALLTFSIIAAPFICLFGEVVSFFVDIWKQQKIKQK